MTVVRWRAAFVAALVVLVLVMGLSASSQKTMRRTEDEIVVAGKMMPAALGWPIAQTRMFAIKQGRAQAIPFQIDEVNADGKYAVTYGPQRSVEDGRISPNDELVFMIFDAGDQGGKELLPAGFAAAVELQITDPVDGGKAWVYLAQYPNHPPPLSSEDYVRFDNEHTRVDTARYAMGFHPIATLSIGYLATKPAGGGNGQNIVDRLKIRFKAEIRGGLGTIDKNEEQFTSRTIGWIDGPVRVVRSTANQMKLWKIKTPSAYLNNVYYLNSFEFPTEVNVPFNPGVLLSHDPTFRVSTDGLCRWLPRVFYNSRNTQGVIVDGAMSEAERKLDLSPYTWSAVLEANRKSGWVNRLIYDHASPAVPLLYYNDDKNHLDPPEDDPGECGDIGYQLTHLDQVKRGKLTLVSVMYQVNNFTLDRVTDLMNIRDQKLRVTSRGL
jgi:hypothetical protein